jgi:hypothetical protein
MLFLLCLERAGAANLYICVKSKGNVKKVAVHKDRVIYVKNASVRFV